MVHKIIIVLCFILIFVGLYIFYKSGRFFRKLFSTGLQGALSLIAVNLIGAMSGITISVNWFTIGAALLYGIPGCIMLLVTQLLFK